MASITESQSKLIIAGSRGCRVSSEEISDAVFAMGISISEVVCGMCDDSPDVDGADWAARWGIPVKQFPADWKKHKRAAGPIRNREMAEYATHLLAFWDGSSRGTADMINQMNRVGKPGLVITVAKYDAGA